MSILRFLSLSLAATLVAGCQSNADDGLNSGYERTEVFAEGIPGGVVSETEELVASVTAIDSSKRSFTLKDAQGNSRTFHAPAEMKNFEQLAVGDKVRATVAQESIVYLRQPGEVKSDGGAALLVTAAPGHKPGMLVADSVEVSAVVKAIDPVQRTATLKFADGQERTIKVRPDVEMKNAYLGREVVLRITSAFAISVEPQ